MFGKEKNDSNEEIHVREEIIYGSFLKDLIVEVKPIESSGKWKTLLVAGQERKKEPFLFNKAKRSFQVPLNNARNGGGVKVILDNNNKLHIKKYKDEFPQGMTEQEFFEKELGKDLNPYLPKDDNFWRMSKLGRVMLKKEGLTLNLNKSLDMLRYKILLSNEKKIARSYEDRKTRQSYEFMIVNQGKMTSQRIEEAGVKAKAYAKYGEITSNKTSMVNFIKSLGRVIPVTHTEDWLKAEILTVVESNPGSFLAKINDPSYEMRIFVQDAVDCGAIKRLNEKRYVLDNGVELGDLMQTINFINDAKNQEVRLRIKSQIEMAKR